MSQDVDDDGVLPEIKLYRDWVKDGHGGNTVAAFGYGALFMIGGANGTHVAVVAATKDAVEWAGKILHEANNEILKLKPELMYEVAIMKQTAVKLVNEDL